MAYKIKIMSNVLKSKSVFGVMIVAAIAVAFAFTAASALAYTHTVTLKMGSTGSQVMSLQQALNAAGNLVSATGAGSPGMESTYFGVKTKAAVVAFQASHGLAADGIVGPMTGAALGGAITGNFPAGCTSASGYSTVTGQPCNAGPSTGLPAGCSTTAGYSPLTGKKCDGSDSSTGGGSTGPLSGGAGSINVSSTSTFSGERAGEGEEEVGVLSFDVEAEDSDVELTAVKVELHQGTAADSEDLADYVTSVQVFLGEDMVGEEEIDEFSEDADVFTKTISLDGAVVREDDEEEVSVRVSVAGNIDSSDRDTAVINVGVSSVRFMDGEGVTSTDSFTLDIDDDAVDETLEESFTIETFAGAANTELQITQGADEDTVNDAHVIDIHATDETEDVEILSFNLEVEGDSDVTIDSLPVRLTVAGQNHVEEMVAGMTLWMDGDEVASLSMSSDCVEDADCDDVGTQETYVFEDLDLTLDAGSDAEFLVSIDIFGLTDTGDVAAGDTILAQFGELETDLTGFDAEDEAGDTLADGDTTGTVTGSASEVRDVGIMVDLVSATAVATKGDASATQSDSGQFTITFDVTAFGADMYIDSTAPDATGGSTESDLTVVPAAGPNGTHTCTITSPSGATEATSFLVQEDETERFTISCDVRDGAVDLSDAFQSIALANLAYAIDDAQTTNIDYTFNLEDFKTPQVFLDDNGA